MEISAEELAAYLKAHPEDEPAVLEILRRLDSKHEVLTLKTNVRARFYHEDGTLYAERNIHNLILTAGKVLLAAVGGTAKYLKDFKYLAIGSGSTAAVVGNTTLGTETARSTVITPTNPTTTSINFSFNFAAGTGTGNVQEYGLNDTATSGGTFLNRIVDASPVPKGATDSLTVDITISIT